MLRLRWKLFVGFLSFGITVVGLTTLLLWVHLGRKVAVLSGPASGAAAAADQMAAGELRQQLTDHWYVVLLLSFVASAPTALFIGWRLNRPIRLLSRAIAQVGEGELHTAIPVLRTRDEFEPLLGHFNAMVAGLRETRELKEALALRDRVEEALREAGDRVDAKVRRHTSELERVVRDRDRVLAHAADLIGVATIDGRFTQVNPAFERVLGHPPEEMTAGPLIDFVHPDDVAATLRELERLGSGLPTVRFENRYRCKDGSFKWLQWTAIPAVEEGVIYAIARDITDRQRAEAAEQALVKAAATMRVAEEIQASVLPGPSFRIDGFDVAGVSRPFAAVGGDYFDFIPTADGHLTLAIGDASGHGLTAALVVAQLQACLWALMVAEPHPLDEVLERANVLLHAKTPSNYYATAMLVRLDTSSHALWHANGGHPPGFVLDRSGRVKARLESGGYPLGCFDRSGVRTDAHEPLDPGDVVLLMTDGLIDAASEAEEPFGEERMLATVREHLHEPAIGIVEAVHEAAVAFSGGAQDDATLVVMKVDG